MEKSSVTLRMELGIPGYKLLEHLTINNEIINSQIEEGIKLAFEDLTKDESLVELIRHQTKEDVKNILKDSVTGWEFKNKLRNKLHDTFENKINGYVDSIADSVIKKLK